MELCGVTVSTVPGKSNLKEKGLRLTAVEVSVHHGRTAQFTRVVEIVDKIADQEAGLGVGGRGISVTPGAGYNLQSPLSSDLLSR